MLTFGVDTEFASEQPDLRWYVAFIDVNTCPDRPEELARGDRLTSPNGDFPQDVECPVGERNGLIVAPERAICARQAVRTELAVIGICLILHELNAFRIIQVVDARSTVPRKLGSIPREMPDSPLQFDCSCARLLQVPNTPVTLPRGGRPRAFPLFPGLRQAAGLVPGAAALLFVGVSLGQTPILVPERTYTFDVIASTGDTPSNAPSALVGMGNGPSINAAGHVAFVGQFGGGEGVVVGDGKTTPVMVNNDLESDRYFGNYIQINNSDQVVANDRLVESTPLYFVRAWDGSIGASGRQPSCSMVADGGGSYPYASVTSGPGLNNLGDAVFGAINTPSPDAFVPPLVPLGPLIGFEPASAISSNNNCLPTYSLSQANLNLPAGSIPFPMVSDQETILVRSGSPQVQPGRIALYNTTLDQNPTKVFADSTTFTMTGNQPGISDDGRAVAFYGVSINPIQGPNGLTAGEGIFTSINSNGNGPWTLIRLTDGSANCDAPNSCVSSPFTFSAPSGQASAFFPNVRVSVTTLFAPSQGPGSALTSVVAVFLAYDGSGQKALWTTSCDITTDGAGNAQCTNYLTTEVIATGDPLVGVVSDISIFDAIANIGSGPSQRPGIHRLVFWAQCTTSNGTKELIVDATSPFNGADVSDNGAANFLTAYDAGYGFVVLRAYGVCFQDPQITSALPAALGVEGLITGIYIVPEWTTSWCTTPSSVPSTPAAQVSATIQSLRQNGINLENVAFVALDVETPDAQGPYPMDVAGQQNRAMQLADAVATVSSLGFKPIIYSDNTYWTNIVGTTMLRYNNRCMPAGIYCTWHILSH